MTSLEKGHGVFAIRYPHTLSNLLAPTPSLNLPLWEVAGASHGKGKKVAVLGVGPLGLDLMRNCSRTAMKAPFINPLYLFPLDLEGVESLLSCQTRLCL
jgi:hypothetical protein